MAIATFVDRFVYSAFNQSAITNASLYVVSKNGLYRISTSNTLHGSDLTLGLNDVLWQVFLGGSEIPLLSTAMQSQPSDYTTGKTLDIYLKAGSVLTVNAVNYVLSGSPPIPIFDSFVVLQPLESF